MSTEFPLRCQCHRRAATSLRCARCSVAICPDCSIVASVGMLCRQCAYGGKNRLFEVKGSSGTMAFLLTPAIATAAGWLLMGLGRSLGWFGLWLVFLYGIGVGESALRLTGRKRGPVMEGLAGGSAGLGIVLGWLLPILTAGPPLDFSLFLLFFSNLWNPIALAIGVWMAVARIRNI